MKKSKSLTIGICIILLLLGITQFSGNFQKTKLNITEIPQDFVFDGCSLFPDGNYGDCCQNHDEDYFFGGTWQQRLHSDNELYSCISEKGGAHKILAPLMWTGVRIGGAPTWPTSFRWGFGRDRDK